MVGRALDLRFCVGNSVIGVPSLQIAEIPRVSGRAKGVDGAALHKHLWLFCTVTKLSDATTALPALSQMVASEIGEDTCKSFANLRNQSLREGD